MNAAREEMCRHLVEEHPDDDIDPYLNLDLSPEADDLTESEELRFHLWEFHNVNPRPPRDAALRILESLHRNLHAEDPEEEES